MQTILVIDDDESLRDTIGIMLEQEGFTPVLVADGKTGFERALSLKPDLMIVDLRLPGMSGTRNLQTGARGELQDADHRAERGGRRSGQGAAARNRRRRLHREALRRARAAGPDSRGAAAHVARELAKWRNSVRWRWTSSGASSASARRAVEDDAGRVQPAHVFSAESGPAVDARHDSEFGVGLRIVSQHADGGRARGAAAPEAGAGCRTLRVIF